MHKKLIRGTLTVFAVLGLFSCSSDSKEDAQATTTPTTTLKYSNVSAFVGSHCASSGCHDSSTKAGSYNMSSRTGIATKATSAASRIESSSSPMPPSGSAEKTSFDSETAGKANLIEWLKAGAPE